MATSICLFVCLFARLSPESRAAAAAAGGFRDRPHCCCALFIGWLRGTVGRINVGL